MMRTFIDHDSSEPELRTIQQEWDKHGSYQWTYFVEKVKQHIDFFLQQRLTGKNLDIGGGWYLSYPNSDVVDISPVCLEYNIAPEERKHLFDLDDIAEGQKLPFKDGSFDSATLISSWQYLSHPWDVVRELERVLKPGAEIYIINGEGAGLSECIVNHTHSNDIMKAFKKRGYDTLVEDIPDSSGNIGGSGCFRSVCVATPYFENENKISCLNDRETRLEKALNFNTHKFMHEFARAEIETETKKLMQLSTYPITNHSQELLKNIEEFSNDYFKETGNIPIFFAHEDSELGFNMALPDKSPHITATILSTENGTNDRDLHDKSEEYGLSFSHTVNYFGIKNLKELIGTLNKIPETDYLYEDCMVERLREKAIEYLAGKKLNKYARKIETEIKTALKSSGIKFERLVNKEIARGLHFEASQYKQRRRIDELIKRKNAILSNEELIADYGQIDVEKYIPYFRRFILNGIDFGDPQLTLSDF